MRPASLDEVVGQEHLLGPGKLLSEMVAAGSASFDDSVGTARTRQNHLALLLAKKLDAEFVQISRRQRRASPICARR